eukprot:2462791-Rhodomonas_salina.2
MVLTRGVCWYQAAATREELESMRRKATALEQQRGEIKDKRPQAPYSLYRECRWLRLWIVVPAREY